MLAKERKQWMIIIYHIEFNYYWTYCSVTHAVRENKNILDYTNIVHIAERNLVATFEKKARLKLFFTFKPLAG
jgi:hypothetical protein